MTRKSIERKRGFASGAAAEMWGSRERWIVAVGEMDAVHDPAVPERWKGEEVQWHLASEERWDHAHFRHSLVEGQS
jgi:hypothetical protein